jgi:hypothetical protein
MSRLLVSFVEVDSWCTAGEAYASGRRRRGLAVTGFDALRRDAAPRHSIIARPHVDACYPKTQPMTEAKLFGHLYPDRKAMLFVG